MPLWPVKHTLFSYSDEIVALAESICTRLAPAEDPDAEASHHHVDLRSMRHTNSRSVGGETVAIHALRELGFDSLCQLCRFGVPITVDYAHGTGDRPDAASGQ